MNLSENRLTEVIARIDAANARDPRLELWAGEEHPKELLYGRRMSAWLERFEPDASEALRIAARAQHLRRWEIPRSDYPEGRAGYLRWRTDLYRFHAERAAEIMEAVGYGQDVIDRVGDLLAKRQLRNDAEAQVLEDVACLVFLEFYLADFGRDHDDDKLVRILRKTWAKMSARGQQTALGIDLTAPVRALVERALAPDPD